MSIAVPFTHLPPPLLGQEYGRIYVLVLNKSYASYKIGWHRLLKFEKRAGSQTSYLHTINTTHISSSSSSSSYVCHGVRPLVDPFRSHVSRSLFRGLPRFLLPVEEQCFITLCNLFRGILFTCCIQLLLYSTNLSKIGVIFKSFANLWTCSVICPKCILLFFSCISLLHTHLHKNPMSPNSDTSKKSLNTACLYP